MATFEAQVEGLTSLSIDGSSAPTQTELTQFLTDGAKEILTVLPKNKKAMYTTSSALDNSTTYLTLGGSEVLGVMRDDGTINQPCRRIASTLSGRAQDSAEMIYGTSTDPVWWVVNNILSIFPEPGSSGATVQTLAYPAVAYGDSSITKFPDEAEYLVPIYASIKAIQNALGSKAGNSDVSTALTYMKAALDQAETAADKFEATTESVFGDEETFLTSNSQLTRVKNALDQVSDIINGNQPSSTTDAFGAQSSEDIELAKSALSIATVEINRAQAHLSEWVAIGDMRVKEINSALAEARGYGEEIQARLSVLTMEYTWLEKQQAKLQVDYDKGLQVVVAG